MSHHHHDERFQLNIGFIVFGIIFIYLTITVFVNLLKDNISVCRVEEGQIVKQSIEPKEMVEKYAVQVDPELHKEVKERYNALGIKPYGGFINPEIVPVVENGNTVDYKIEYPSDFLQQHLDYGTKYATISIVR